MLAPTDAAFTTALTSLGYRNLTTVPRALLTSVLQYHGGCLPLFGLNLVGADKEVTYDVMKL